MSSTRREFLKASLGASTLCSMGPVVPGFLRNLALAEATRSQTDETILVVVQLTGGNDGLNTVVPFEDSQYNRSRSTLRLSADRVLKVDSQLGFHPQMVALRRLYDQGYLSVIQGVGYPNSSRDHDAAMRDWHTASPDQESCETGWIGRTVDKARRPTEAGVSGAFVGEIQPPFALNAERSVIPSIRALEDCVLKAPVGANTGEAADGTLLEFLQENARKAHATSQRIEAVLEARKSAKASPYPQFKLANTLKIVAELIRAEIGIRVFFTEFGGGGIGGFDTHANQGGNHGALLHQLSDSVAAMVKDLEGDKLHERVLLMTFSEFGRTVAENGRRGTDHGVAAPLFLAGGKLQGGLVGAHPSLTDLDNGAMRFHTDFRRVYATVLDSWLGYDSQAILGEKFEPLDGVLA